MGASLFRKREQLSERQRVLRTLKTDSPMGPVSRPDPGAKCTTTTPRYDSEALNKLKDANPHNPINSRNLLRDISSQLALQINNVISNFIAALINHIHNIVLSIREY